LTPRAEKSETTLILRLHKRRAEIEEATLTRISAIDDPSQAPDPEYAAGLRGAVSAAIDYGLAAIAQGNERPLEIPVPLLAQARIAARSGIGLETVLRRYVAGFTLLGEFLIEAAEEGGVAEGPTLKRWLRTQAAYFDRLLAMISEEYAREPEPAPGTPQHRRLELVQRLLDGERLDAHDLAYDFEAVHLGLIASGPKVAAAIRDLASILDSRLLLVPHLDGAIWAWLGYRWRLDREAMERFVTSEWPSDAVLAVGEPSRGLSGWRRTHLQAREAYPIASARPGRAIRYGEVALTASMRKDDLLTSSLHQIYLAPLEAERDGGVTARETLQAYFAADRNATSAAAALGVSRRTVTNRLRVVEDRLGRSLSEVGSELEAALRLHELEG
jgi:hypothetical protein